MKRLILAALLLTPSLAKAVGIVHACSLGLSSGNQVWLIYTEVNQDTNEIETRLRKFNDFINSELVIRSQKFLIGSQVQTRYITAQSELETAYYPKRLEGTGTLIQNGVTTQLKCRKQ